MTESELDQLSSRFRSKYGDDAAQHALMRLVENGMLESKPFLDCLRFGLTCAKHHVMSEAVRRDNSPLHVRLDAVVDDDIYVYQLADPIDMEAQIHARLEAERVRPVFEPVMAKGLQGNSVLFRLRQQYRKGRV